MVLSSDRIMSYMFNDSSAFNEVSAGPHSVNPSSESSETESHCSDSLELVSFCCPSPSSSVKTSALELCGVDFRLLPNLYWCERTMTTVFQYDEPLSVCKWMIYVD